MAHPLLPRKRSTASIRRQYEELGIEPPSDLLNEEKSAQYRSPGYEKELQDKGDSFMYESDLDITDESKALCRTLLSSAQTVVEDSLFRDDRFKAACRKIHNENEAMVLQDITRLIVPSAKNLATCGATALEHLVESVDRGWNSAIPVTSPRPQPDYSVAFGQSAFTYDQNEKLKPFLGNLLRQPTEFSYFMATWKMYFPFLTCEVKCGASALDIADRQNAHSMTHAVRAVVQLYRYARWEQEFDWKKELHREILAFSISHDDTTVRIYGHYPVIEDDRTTYYRHQIRIFNFTDLDGRDKWTAYKFTKNVYDIWMPKHLKRITKAIDALPAGLNFEVSSASFTSATSVETSSELPDSQEIAVSAPSSQDTQGFKKPKLPPKVMLQKENDRLKEQLNQQFEWQRQEADRQRQEFERQWHEFDQQLKRQRQEESERHKQESERQRQEFERQWHEFNQQLKWQRQESERHKQEIEQQKQESEQKLERQMQESERHKQEIERQKQESEQKLEQQTQDNAGLKGQIDLLLKQQKEFMDLLKQQNSANA